MGPFEAIVIIVIAVMIANVLKSKNQAKYGSDRDERDERGERGKRQQHQSQDSKELQLELMAMKKRIEALEAIVTDKSYNLEREIDRL